MKKKIKFAVQRGTILEIHHEDGGIKSVGLDYDEKLKGWTENTVTTQRIVGSTLMIKTYDSDGVVISTDSTFVSDPLW